MSGPRIRRMMARGLAICAISLPAVPAMAHAPDPLTAMFTWWNGAFVRPGGFTQSAFDRWFTPDATLTLNGQRAVHGTREWAQHFQAIQARGGVVEIVVPFRKVVRSGDHIYTYHIIRARSASGVTSCMLAAGDAQLRGGKIAAITLVRHALDPAKGEDDRDCFHDQ